MRDILHSIDLKIDKRCTAGYSSESVRIAAKLIRMYGATNDEIQQVLKIDIHTFMDWLSIHPEFMDEIQAARDEVNSSKVEAALLKRAIGYDTEEQEESVNAKGAIKTTKKRVHVPGDVSAQKFFLEKRSSRRWPEKKEKAIAPGSATIIAILQNINATTLPLAHVHALKTIDITPDTEGTQASTPVPGDTI